MKARAFGLISLCLGLIICFAIPVSADTIFSNFGPGDSYATNTGRGLSVGSPFGVPEGDFDLGHDFTPGSDFLLDSVELAVGLRVGNNELDVWLMTDAAGKPGTIIEAFHFSGAMGRFGAPNPPLRANSILRPLLSSGIRYWLVASLTGPHAKAAWNLNAVGERGPIIFRLDLGPWTFATSDLRLAFRISGTPANQQARPEISVTPLSLDFGNVPVSTEKSLSMEVLSSGTADLTVNSIESFFSLEDVPVLPTVLVPGESFAFEVVFAPQVQGTFSGNVAIFSDAPTSPTFVPVTGEGVPPQPPPGFRATVGNQRVYLDWDPSPDPVDGYNIQVARFDGSNFVELGTVNPLGQLIQNTSFRVFGFANGEFVENGQLYRFTVTAVKNTAESVPSNEMFAVPGAFAIRHRPENPILFLHGLQVSECIPLFPRGEGAKSWDETVDFLTSTVGWEFGGELFNQGNVIRSQFRNNFFEPNGDFFTASFGNGCANYADGSGISHQAIEVGDFLLSLRRNSAPVPMIIVTHSMGGLGARAFLATSSATSTLVSHLVTYGTPHRGASFAFLDAQGIASDGVRDMDFDCVGGQLVLSPFLDELATKLLPDIRYTSIVGHSHINFFEIPGTFLDIPLPPHRVGGCLSRDFDGLVPIDSANLRQAVVLRPRTHGTIITNRTHVKQTADISGFLCALDPNCLQFRLFSPVEIEVTAPDDRSISRGLSAIPGASYMEIEEGNGDASAIVLIPFPLSGDYTIEVSPKSGASPTDTFTLELTRAGTTTVLAEDRQIQDIPSEPFVASVFFIDIKPGSLPNSINPKSRGKIPVAVLSNPDFDAPNLVNRTSLTFGRTGDETSLAFCNKSPEDVNGDGSPDLVCHFDTVKASFQLGDTRGVLKGQTIERIPIIATDSVRIFPK